MKLYIIRRENTSIRTGTSDRVLRERSRIVFSFHQALPTAPQGDADCRTNAAALVRNDVGFGLCGDLGCSENVKKCRGGCCKSKRDGLQKLRHCEPSRTTVSQSVSPLSNPSAKRTPYLFALPSSLLIRTARSGAI